MRHPDGRFGGAQAKGEDIQTNNPLAYLYKNEGNKKERNFRAAFNGVITPFKGLSISGSYSYELTDKDNWSKPNLNDLWDFQPESVVRAATDRTKI